MTDAMFTTIWQSRELNTKKLLSKDLTSREHKKCVSFHRVTQPLPHHPLTIKRSTASTNLSNVNLLPLTSVESSDSLSSLDSLEMDTTLEKETNEGSATEPPSVLEKNYRFKDILQLPAGVGEEINESQDTVTSAGGEGNYTNDKEAPQPALEETADRLDRSLTLILPLEDEEGEEESSGPMKDEESSSTDTESSETEDGNASIVTVPPAAKEPKYTQIFSHPQEIKVGPKSLHPVEITHCLFELEEECKGVERISEDVKGKMLLIHSSTVSIQEKLRTLQRRLAMGEDSGSGNNHIKCIIPRFSTPFPEQRMHTLPFHSPTRDINSPLATSHPHPHHRHHDCTSPLHYIPGRTSITALPVHGVTHHRHHDCTSPLHYIPGRTSITALPEHGVTHHRHHDCTSPLHYIPGSTSITALPEHGVTHHRHHDCTSPLHYIPGSTSITALPEHGVTHHRYHDCTSPLHYIPGRTSITALPVHSPQPCSTTHPNAAHHSCISSLHPILRHASDTTMPIQTLSVNWQRDSDASLDMVFDLR
ncbi:testis-specific serine kinase substrate-like [Acipenser oxyrinchus oxyrinchus]|uniref:Testis-specific serine kinase substrate-like n=1 Tax=Acipenser oxyrinchus oxyrinchus TaxID=40147 RepID=A0AAD8CYY9_ACIOX|nr:testis-specific serine kinase substrate-like [Acipenser oxyrinchus oxyrinchus]